MNKYLAIFGKPRYLGIVTYENQEDNLEKGVTIVVESYRGEELAVVAGELSDEQEKGYRLLKNVAESGDGLKSCEPVVTDLAFIKFAAESDLENVAEYREEEQDIFRQAKELLKPHDLDMKLIDVEFLRKRRKLFFYFSSEQRVDFRAYVRDLAREFKTRIELRQIGVRDEAKIIRGISPCGQPCCCSYWLNQFAPINIRMVKEQNLALNPSKISGICGRLMCCMHYEHNVYHEIWARLPNPGSKIKTPNGNIIVAGIDLTSESVRCFIPGRGEQKIPIGKFDEFKETVMEGKQWDVAEENGEQQENGRAWAAVKPPRGKSALREPDAASAEPAAEKKKETKTSPPRRERREKAPDAAPATEQPAKRKRRPRGRGGAPRQAETAPAAAVAKKPIKTEAAPQPEGEASAKRKSRRPRRRGGRQKKNEAAGTEKGGSN